MSYKLSKTDGGPIDGTIAAEWIEKYKNKHKDGINAYFFGSDIINKVLSPADAVGFRVHLAYSSDENSDKDIVQMVLLAARADGSIIWPDNTTGKDSGGGTAGDNGMPSPPY